MRGFCKNFSPMFKDSRGFPHQNKFSAGQASPQGSKFAPLEVYF